MKLPKGVRIEYIQQPRKRHKDSFWYDGQVAIVHGKRKVSIEAMGEINVIFNPNEPLFTNEQARKIATERDYSDIKLKNLYLHDGWQNNNWFGFYLLDEKRYDESYTSINYDDALLYAVQLAQQEVETSVT